MGPSSGSNLRGSPAGRGIGGSVMPIGKVDHNDVFNEISNALLESIVRRIVVYIVIAVLDIGEVDNEAVGDAALSGVVSGQRRRIRDAVHADPDLPASPRWSCPCRPSATECKADQTTAGRTCP